MANDLGDWVVDVAGGAELSIHYMGKLTGWNRRWSFHAVGGRTGPTIIKIWVGTRWRERRVMQIDLPTLTCLRCGHVWTPRKVEVIVCSKCKSPYWDKPRQEAGDEVAQDLS
jgi:hypothetical protein